MGFNNVFVDWEAIANCIPLQYTALDKCKLHRVQTCGCISHPIHNLNEYLFHCSFPIHSLTLPTSPNMIV